MSVPQALQLLQLEPGATRKQIRAAYKRLALQLHPDKQHQHPQKQQQQSTAAFARLAAAYSLLLQGHRHHLQQQQHQQQDQEELQPFETAYATGSLFSEQLVDEAARCQADPADIWNLELLAAAAADGQLAQQLAAHPPTAADEQLWQQLHMRLQLRQQARHKQQQQQPQPRQQQDGVGVGELLTDLLLRPTGPLFVEEVSEESDSDSEQWGSSGKVCLRQQQQQPLLQVAGAAAGGQQQDGAATAPAHAPQQPHQQQVVQLHTHNRQPQQQQQQQQPGGKPPRQLRHGWGFYWMWLRRALLAKALLSVVSSGLKAKLYEHRFPKPLPLSRA